MGSTSFVVVALPSENDNIAKYSSEKKPHLTLCYLDGSKFDSSQLELAMGYVQHAASELSPFMLHVEERGTLGDKNADVLFFEKSWSKNIARFRDSLLRNDLMMTAYQSADQFPQWTPHLTMGYPETPAKKYDREDDGFSYVNFDRIAFWMGDSEGPEFKLKYPDDGMELAMSQIDRGRAALSSVLSHADSGFNLEDEYGGFLDFLEKNLSELDGAPVEHSGVKGMKWGIRKDRSSSTREPLKSLGPDSVSRKTASGETITLKKVPPSKIHKVMGRISKGYRDGYSKQASLTILDGSGKKVGDANVTKKSDEELNLEWLGIDKSARGKGYATAVMKAGRDFGKQQGFKRMTLEVPGHSPDARHIYEKLGFKVTKEAESTDDFWGGLTEMAYEFDATQSVLAHYGVKGMKWGVTRSDSGSSGGTRSEDARDFEKNNKKIQTHGTKALSNKELQSVLNRMNMENQYHNLASSNRDLVDSGHDQVKKILKIGKTVEEARKFLNTPTGQAIKTGLFGAATVGAAYATGGASSAAAAGAQVAVRRMGNHFTNVGN
jgi:ribosomal protein S18 acetylase RimI-like enzyme/2'-5' RNA ligase